MSGTCALRQRVGVTRHRPRPSTVPSANVPSAGVLMIEVSSGSTATHRWRVVAVVAAMALVLVAVVGVLVVRTLRGDLPSDMEKAEYIASLELTVLPVVEDLKVEYFMDESDCAILTYPRGDFIAGDPEDCGGSPTIRPRSTTSPGRTTPGLRPPWQTRGRRSSGPPGRTPPATCVTPSSCRTTVHRSPPRGS